MFTLTFAQPVDGFDFEQVGGCILNSGRNWINATETALRVGDAITDDFGGDPIIAQNHGQTTKTEIAGRQNDYRDAYAEKNFGK